MSLSRNEKYVNLNQRTEFIWVVHCQLCLPLGSILMVVNVAEEVTWFTTYKVGPVKALRREPPDKDGLSYT